MIPFIIVTAVIVGAMVVALPISKLIDYMDTKGVRESLILTTAVTLALTYGAITATIIVAVAH